MINCDFKVSVRETESELTVSIEKDGEKKQFKTSQWPMAPLRPSNVVASVIEQIALMSEAEKTEHDRNFSRLFKNATQAD